MSEHAEQPDRPAGRLSAWVPLACVLLAAAAFAPSIATGTFINGPDSVLRLPLLGTWRNLPTIFGEDFMFFTDAQYRPGGPVVLMFLRTFVSPDVTWFWHGLLVALHALAAMMVYRIARRFGSGEVPALAAAGVFLLHPLASIFGNDMNRFHHLLASVLFVGGFLAWLRFGETRRWRWYAFVVAAMTLGILTSKVLIALPVLIVLVALIHDRLRSRRALLEVLPLVLLVLAMVPCWVFLQPNPLFFVRARLGPGDAWHSTATLITAAPRMALGLLGGWGIPAPLGDMVQRAHLTHPAAIVCGALVLGLLVLGLACLRRRPLFGLGLTLMVLSQAPFATQAFHRVHDFISWDTLYLTLAGFALTVGGLLAMLLSTVRDREARRLVVAMSMLPLALFTTLLVVRNTQTRTPERYWTHVLSINPRSSGAWVALGRDYLRRNMRDEALRCLFRPQVKFVPLSCLLMTRYYCQKDDLIAAAAHMRHSINAPAAGYQAQNEALIALGEISEAVDALDYAEDSYARLLMRDPWSTEGMRRVATILADKGYVRAAMRWMERAVRIEPDNPENRRLLDDLVRRHYPPEDPGEKRLPRPLRPRPADRLRYASAGPTSRAMRGELTSLARSRPEDPVLQMAAGECYFNEENYAAAFTCFDNAGSALATYPYVWAAKAHLAMLVGRDDEAEKAAARAALLDPTQPNVTFALGFLQQKKGNLKDAAEFFRISLRYGPDWADTHSALGVVLLRMGEYEEAATHFAEAIRLGADTANVHYNLASSLTMLNRLDEALAQFRIAVRRLPNDVHVHRGLADALLLVGRYDEAYATTGAALDRFPNDVPLVMTLTRLLSQSPVAHLRDGDEAVRLAEAACRQEQQTGVPPELLDVLAGAYAEAGRFPEAVAAAAKAIEEARGRGNNALADEIKARLALYRTGRPFRMGPPERAGRTRPGA